MATASLSYHYAVPSWTVSAAEERRFRRIFLVVFVLSVGTGLVMPWLPRPVEDREAQAALPPRYAKMLLEHEPVVLPPPKPEPRLERVKPAAPQDRQQHLAEKAVPVPEAKAEASEAEVAAERVAAARRKAAGSGLLAMQDDLADLRSAPETAQLNQKIRQGPGAGSGPATPVSRAMITSGLTTGSGGVSTSSFSTGLGGGGGGGGGGLAGRATTRVQAPAGAGGGARGGQVARGNDSAGKASRSLEDIRLVMEKNKAAIYAIYNRALRDDPGLTGKVVIQLKIAPSGEVMDCQVASSELHAAEFERKLLARIRQFDFGAKDVAVMELTYPLDFRPS